jgi:hypothetical protein
MVDLKKCMYQVVSLVIELYLYSRVWLSISVQQLYFN